ncbi:MAG: hypothetical protein ACREJM_07610, partial [Candidatus Saccharimonadales bacterium]
MAVGLVLNHGHSILRFNPDGTPDDTFGSNGIVESSVGTFDEGILEQPDGKYLYTADAGPGALVAQRFFGEAPPAASNIPDVSVAAGQSATTFSLLSYFEGATVPASQLQYSIATNTNPGLFASANIDPQTGNLMLSYAADQTGSALLAVRATDPDGASAQTTFHVTVSSALAAGALDPAFGTNGLVLTPACGQGGGLSAVAVLPGGKLLVAGTVQPNGSNGNYVLARYNANGSLDTTFGVDGFVTTIENGQAWGALVQQDGKIIVSGNSNTFADTTLVRYNADGSLDASFGIDGQVSAPIGGGGQVVQQADGRLVVISGDQGGFGVARYNANGTLDTAFGTG